MSNAIFRARELKLVLPEELFLMAFDLLGGNSYFRAMIEVFILVISI